jgi:hypothetical protein
VYALSLSPPLSHISWGRRDLEELLYNISTELLAHHFRSIELMAQGLPLQLTWH